MRRLLRVNGSAESNPWHAGLKYFPDRALPPPLRPAPFLIEILIVRGRGDAQLRAEFYRMLAGVVIDDAQLFNTKLQEWERFFNFGRPHGALDGLTPYERLRKPHGASV